MMQDRDLSAYNPALSNTSQYLSCSHQLCAWSTTCKSPDDPCSYKRDYYTDNTSTSGFMIEDKLHLASFSKHGTQRLLQASVVLGWALTASHTLMLFFDVFFFFYNVEVEILECHLNLCL